MLHRQRFYVPIVVVILLLGAGYATASSVSEFNFELMGPLRTPIPPNCSDWQEFFPQSGQIHHQDDYIDSDGNGELDRCDFIQLNGVWFHIEWTGPTYHLTCGIFEPFLPEYPSGQDPTCETWIEIWPENGTLWHVDGWLDGDGDGLVSVCDIVVIGGQTCHIDEIGVNIRAIPEDPVASEQLDWGEVKSQFVH
jgi:hypothetical protein